MGVLDAFASDTDAAFRAMDARPEMPEPPKPKHSAWTAIPRALAAAGAEVVGNVSDVLDAFGQTAAATGGMGAGIRTPDEKRDQQADEAFRKLTTEGIDWRSEDSRAAYAFGRDLRPDPLTAGAAEQAVFGITKSVTKAVGSALTLGPVGGALGFGLSEGMTAAEDLADQGVDAETRFKVGGITAGMGTVGALLPVAGSTTAKTVALVVGGGPASFMAQQAAISSVLENADYGELAAQYDPLDPLGLTIATLVPAAFGTAARLGARRASSPQADVDAAMTHNLTAMQDLRAAVDDVTGQPSPDVQGEMGGGARAAADTETQIRVMEPEKVVAGRMPSSPSEDTEGGKYWAFNLYQEREIPDGWFVHGRRGESIDTGHVVQLSKDWDVADQYARGGGNKWLVRAKDGADVLDLSGRDTADMDRVVQAAIDDFHRGALPWLDDVEAALGREADEADIEVAVREEFSPDNIVDSARAYDNEAMSGWIADRFDYPAMVVTPDGAVVFNADAVDSVMVPRAEDVPVSKGGDLSISPADVTAQVADATPAAQQADAANDAPDAVAARVKQVLDEQPDLVARVGDDGKPVKWADELEAVRKEAQEGTDDALGAMDAPLLQVAAECALATGTAGL